MSYASVHVFYTCLLTHTTTALTKWKRKKLLTSCSISFDWLLQNERQTRKKKKCSEELNGTRKMLKRVESAWKSTKPSVLGKALQRQIKTDIFFSLFLPLSCIPLWRHEAIRKVHAETVFPSRIGTKKANEMNWIWQEGELWTESAQANEKSVDKTRTLLIATDAKNTI